MAVYLFFFFQAEDGIRDGTVTGVQTCALPISLAHLAHVIIGEGQAVFRGETLPGNEAMKRAGIAPIELEAKEGLSLLNGTQGMLALLGLALREADVLADSADVAASLSLDALRGSPGAFDARIMHARAYAGAATTARNLAHLNDGSQIRESHRGPEKDPRVQDETRVSGFHHTNAPGFAPWL